MQVSERGGRAAIEDPRASGRPHEPHEPHVSGRFRFLLHSSSTFLHPASSSSLVQSMIQYNESKLC